MLVADLDDTGAAGSADLLHAARAGDEHAWAQLVDRHTALLWSIARSFGLGRAAAEDVVQTVWLRLLERGHTIREPAAVTAWLITTARRECLAVCRAGRRNAGPDALPEIVDSRTPEEASLRSARDRLLWRAFHRLSERDAVLLVLLVHGTPYEQVAAALDMPRGSVGPTKVRALRKLRAELVRSEVHDLTDAL
jgi:RNA polymerase sigma factor (sigma-70 family)